MTDVHSSKNHPTESATVINRRELCHAMAAGTSGLLFGLGLAIAGMTDPRKVLGFLDIAGDWDASLMLVLGAAVTTALIGFQLLLRQPLSARKRPLLDTHFHLPYKTAIDRQLVTGAVLFGIGWGISGYCPGPAIALLAAPQTETWIFLPGMIAGWWVHCRFFKP